MGAVLLYVPVAPHIRGTRPLWYRDDTRDTATRLEIERGGLVLRWEATNDNDSVDRHQKLRCSQTRSAWLLAVTETGIGLDNGVIGQNNADGMQVLVGDQVFPMVWQTRSAPGGNRLPDRSQPARRPSTSRGEFRFQTNNARTFWQVLSANLRLPDADTLDAMARACGS